MFLFRFSFPTFPIINYSYDWNEELHIFLGYIILLSENFNVKLSKIKLVSNIEKFKIRKNNTWNVVLKLIRLPR